MSTLTTSNLCIICGTQVSFGEDTTIVNSRREICFKFTTLVTRYLNLESTKDTNVNSTSTFNDWKNSICCFICLAKVEAFCDTYHKLNCVQLELLHIVDSLSTLMEVTSSTVHYKFQEEFISNVKTKRRRHGLLLGLEKLNETELRRQKLRAEEIEGEIPGFIKPEMQDDEFEERASGCGDDLGHSVSEFEVEKEFESPEEQGEELKMNVEPNVAHDDKAKGMEIEDIAKMIIESSFPQKAICVNSKPKIKPNLPKQCIMCGKTFPDYFRLHRHINSHTGEKPFHCPICLKEFTESQSFTKHKRTEHLNGRMECDIWVNSKPIQNLPLSRQCLMCGKTFHSHFNLCNHIRSHTGERVYHCRICLKEIAGNHQFNKHKLTQHLNGGVKCDICSKRVKNLESHCGNSHRPYTKVFCDRCGRTFNDEYKLKPHVTNCHVVKTYFCDMCGKQFTFSENFQRHMKRIHGNDKPTQKFKCPYFPCQRAFYDNYHLAQHIRSHTGERPFKCGKCGNAFSQRGYLKIHMESHFRIKKFTCEICGQDFRQKQGLKNHEKKHLKDDK